MILSIQILRFLFALLSLCGNRSLKSETAVPFDVEPPRGSNGSACDDLVSISWKSSSGPNYFAFLDVLVVTAAEYKPVLLVEPNVDGRWQDERVLPNLYLWDRLPAGADYRIAILPKRADGSMIQSKVSFSRPFWWPRCDNTKRISNRFLDRAIPK